MKHILIKLPKNRIEPGALELFDESNGLMARMAARGKADHYRAIQASNPDRLPILPYGDTPAGDYAETHIVIFDEVNERLGRGWIPMLPVSGEALRAQENGRTGLGIHGGRGNTRLIATYGCVRIFDTDFDYLAEVIGTDSITITVEDF